MHLVVAHYKEDLAWLDALLATGHTADIYEKGEGTRGPQLPNVGRESGTWLHHIVTHYDNFPDYTCFMQGGGIDHAPKLLEDLQNPRDYADLGSWIYTSDAIGNPWRQDCPVCQFYEEFVGRPFPGVIDFCVGGQFMASRRALRSRPASWWLRLQERHDKHEFGPWTLERLWHSLLPGPFA